MPNYFTENSDILFHFENLDMREIVQIAEDNFEESKKYNYAPINYEDAMENYKKVLEVVGDISGNFIEPRSKDVDLEGAHYKEGDVEYAKGTQENLNELAKADLMGMVLPRRFGGLNFPMIIYI